VKITIDLPTELLNLAEATAAERGLHLNDLVEYGLRLAIENPPAALPASQQATTPPLDPAPTPKQAQYLAFIHHYTLLNRQPPSQADIQRYFRTSPPSVHNMILRLEENGWLERIPGQARALRVLVPPEQLPPLED
jgi:predicted Rossmann fold nucleotide-binding protein DprA/Smf involved in DNA uptake